MIFIFSTIDYSHNFLAALSRTLQPDTGIKNRSDLRRKKGRETPAE